MQDRDLQETVGIINHVDADDASKANRAHKLRQTASWSWKYPMHHGDIPETSGMPKTLYIYFQASQRISEGKWIIQ